MSTCSVIKPASADAKTRLPNPIDNLCVYCRLSLLIFRSYRYKVCAECGQEYDYLLKDNQQSLIRHQR